MPDIIEQIIYQFPEDMTESEMQFVLEICASIILEEEECVYINYN